MQSFKTELQVDHRGSEGCHVGRRQWWQAGGQLGGGNGSVRQESERHEIALEPHWFRVQTERIKRCNLQAKKDY
ncbi:BQ5605_C012g06712 [Microbotryum silenes-dioicae]|uniref:BQ5605_C012g06712 protein n=1 Tax=Microbotryum silenes-dioicae TaxID=796604 RepID=A0A2X0LWC2_9BASI|nr:BQ5605_C012g06712 [Microbotryum silenes-dioicae]